MSYYNILVCYIQSETDEKHNMGGENRKKGLNTVYTVLNGHPTWAKGYRQRGCL